MTKDNDYLKFDLKALMQRLSIFYYGTSFYDDCSFTLWKAILRGNFTNSKYGNLEKEKEKIKDLKEFADLVDGWWYYDHISKEILFVSLDIWLTLFDVWDELHNCEEYE